MATLKDIADHVGISVSTASLALRDQGSISLETKRRVWEAQEALGYRAPLRVPNSLGKTGKKPKTSTRDIAFLLVDREFENSSYGPLFQRVAEFAAERQWRSFYVSASLEDLREGRIPPLIKNGGVDGIVVSGAYDAVAHQHVRKLGIPLAICGRYQLGDDPWMSCEPDFAQGIRLFASRMTAFGHARYGLVVKRETPNSFLSHLQRTFIEVLAEKNLEYLGAAATEEHENLLSLEALLEKRPTALLIATPFVAPDLYDTCRKAGLRIPEDISVISFSTARSCLISPSLAYLDSRLPDMERGVVEKLERLMDDPDLPPTRELFSKCLVPGGSIGLCPGATPT